MPLELLPATILELYEVKEWKHACAVLKQDFPEQWDNIIRVLTDFRLHKSHILVGGGRKSKVAAYLDDKFAELGWEEKKFDTEIVVDEHRMKSPTHKVDCFKNRVALEIEWNNKDPFYDRDLNNFRLLFDLRAVSVGVIITRADELQDIFNSLGDKIRKKYGMSTTHMGRLVPRIEGGGGGGCPILVFAIKRALYREDL